MQPPDLAERERVGRGAGIEERDLESPLGNVPVLPDELVQPLLAEHTGAVLVRVGAVIRAGRLPVDEHAEPHRGSRGGGPHHQVDVAGLEAATDLAAGRVQRGRLVLCRPVTCQRPLVQPEPLRDGIEVRLARHDATGRGEVLGAAVAGVVFR